MLAINPSAEEAICRLSAFVSSEDEFLNGVAAAALENAEMPLNGRLSFLTDHVEVAFHRQRLTELPEVVVRRAVRLAVETLGGQFDSHETMVLLEGLKGRSSGSVTAIGGTVVVEWDLDKVHVHETGLPEPFACALTVPGETVSEELGWRIAAVTGPPSSAKPTRSSLNVEIPIEALKGGLMYRNAAQADEMRPLGFSGHRKLSDLMGEARLTQCARARLPIVCDLAGPLWAPGVCVDDRIGRPQDAKIVTVLRFEPVNVFDRHNKETGPMSRA
jgi:tRNA(Ile)-lysidine synthase